MDNLQENVKTGDNYTLYLGDCVDKIQQLPDESLDFSVFSPPFSNLYVYSKHHADMGNSKDDDEFQVHFGYLLEHLYKKMKSGRVVAVHCADIPTFKWKEGYSGYRDFSGAIIRAMESHGFVYHSRVTIWKDPVVEVTRTKAHGLLHKTFSTKGEKCRVGNPDYLITFVKMGDSDIHVSHEDIQIGEYIGENAPTIGDYTGYGKSDELSYSIAVWQRYASPVWFDIDQTKTLNFQEARNQDDERHICPLQLDVISRAIYLWSNKGETVFSPFAGIGSEGHEAIKMGRKFIGIELKDEYFNVAIKNLENAERQSRQKTLF